MDLNAAIWMEFELVRSVVRKDGMSCARHGGLRPGGLRKLASSVHSANLSSYPKRERHALDIFRT